MNNTMDSTMIEYKKQHEVNKGHKVTLFGNFTQCTCGQHAHYYKNGIMIEHDRLPESYKQIKVNMSESGQLLLGYALLLLAVGIVALGIVSLLTQDTTALHIYNSVSQLFQ